MLDEDGVLSCEVHICLLLSCCSPPYCSYTMPSERALLCASAAATAADDHDIDGWLWCNLKEEKAHWLNGSSVARIELRRESRLRQRISLL